MRPSRSSAAVSSSPSGIASRSSGPPSPPPIRSARASEDREIGEPEEVELEQADPRHVVHVELRRRQGLLVALAARRGALQRRQPGERLARDHDPGGVRAGVAGDALEAARGVDQLAHRLVALGGEAQLLDLAEGGVDGDAERVGDEAGDAVDVAEAHAEGAPAVADRGLRAEGAEGHDLRHAVAAVALGGVADHLLAAVVREVEVHVRHLAPLGVEEALEDQPVLRRLDVGDAEAVEHDRGGGRAAHAHRDAPLAREAGDVAHDQDVLDEAGLLDHAQLVAQPLALRLAGVAVAVGEALLAEGAEVGGGGRPLGDAGVGQQRAPEVEADVHLFGDAGGGVAGAGEFGQQRPHLLLGAEVEGAALELHAVGLVDRGVGADAEQHVVGALLVGRGVVGVVGEHERQAELAGEGHEPRVEAAELLLPVLLQLDVVTAGEDVGVPAERLAGVRLALLGERRHDLARGAAGERDQAVRVPRQQLAVDARAVVEAFEVGGRGELQQVAVPGLVLREQREVPGRARRGVAVEAAPRRDVALEADDRVQAVRARLVVEAERAVEVPVVRDRERVLPQRLRARDQVRDGAEPVQQGVLAVRMQMREHRETGLCPCANGRTAVVPALWRTAAGLSTGPQSARAPRRPRPSLRVSAAGRGRAGR